MAFRPEFSVDAERDFGLIFDHLLRSCLGFGENMESALDRAEARIRMSTHGIRWGFGQAD